MKAIHGNNHFSFVPDTFILPNELNSLQDAMLKEPNTIWIVKPSASA